MHSIHTSAGRVQLSKIILIALEGSPFLYFFKVCDPSHQVPACRQVHLDLSAQSSRGIGPRTPSTVGTGMRHRMPTPPGRLWHRESLPCWLSSRQPIKNFLPFCIGLILCTGPQTAFKSAVLFHGPSLEKSTGPGTSWRMTGNFTKAGGPVDVLGRNT